MPRHYRMRGNKSRATPRRLVFVDCESSPQPHPTSPSTDQHLLRLGCATTFRWRGNKPIGRTEFDFDNLDQFWDWLDEIATPNETCWIFAHRLAFDATLLGLWPQIAKKRVTFDKPRAPRKVEGTALGHEYSFAGLLVLADPPTLIGLRNLQGARLVLVDTLNYWRDSLEELGHSIGLTKLPFPSFCASDATWRVYCRRDVEIIERAVTQLMTWWYENDYGQFAYTAPSLADHCYRHRFAQYPVDFHDFPEVRAIERASYFAGRLEAHYLGHWPARAHYVDANSLYPAMMRDNVFPVRLLRWGVPKTMSTTQPPITPQYAIAEVEIETDRPEYPLRTGVGTIFPIGRFITVLAGPELIHAYRAGRILSWGAWASYLCKPIFTEYVNHFWEKKLAAELAGDRVQRSFVKLLLNSLAGKFGQRSTRWRINSDRTPLWDFGTFIEHDWVTNERVMCLGLWDVVMDQVQGHEVIKSFPAIPAFVCAHARRWLWDQATIAGKQNFLYLTTDAMIVTEQGLANLEAAGQVAKGELGKLKIEHSGDDAQIDGLHWYRVGQHVVRGGVPAKATMLDGDRWAQMTFERLESIVGRGGNAYVNVTAEIRKRRTDYARGIRQPDGWVHPYLASELPAVVTVRSWRDSLVKSAELFGHIRQVNNR